MTQHVDQVGGTHYSAAFQHWDWAAETGLGYLEGNASKYLARHRKKGGRQDLEKALSYVEKRAAVEAPDRPAGERPGRDPVKLTRFLLAAGLMDTPEGELIQELDGWLTEGALRNVAAGIQELIDDL